MIKLAKSIKTYCILHSQHVIAQIENPANPSVLRYPLAHQLKRIDDIKRSLLRFFPEEELVLDGFISSTMSEFKEIRERKVEKLLRPPNVYVDNSAVVNLTDIEIPEDLAFIMAAGPKFCFPPSHSLLNTVSFLAHTLYQLEESCPVETHSEIYKQISIEMTKEKLINRETRGVWLEFLKYRIKEFKAKHPDVLITKGDKGKHTVILPKHLYDSKINDMVNTTEDYMEIDAIDVASLTIKTNAFVNSLILTTTISPEDKSKYEDKCCNPAQFYGLVKVHKTNFPLRPIAAACGSNGFNLAKLFTNILTEIFNEKSFHVINPPDFIKMLKDVEVTDDDIMISCDVISMFTNIPIDHVLKLVEKRSDVLLSRFHIGFELFSEIFNFLLRECAVFTCNGRFFKQRDSLAMGSPLSPILAKILMNDVMSYTLPKMIFEPKIVALYVDDSFWLLKRKQVNLLHAVLNTYHPRIKFTVEEENNNKLNFLNMTIHRVDNELLTNWFVKPFASHRLLNYYSHHPLSCIVETAIAYVKGVLQISHAQFFRENMTKLEHMLRMNSFPECDIITIMHQYYTLMRPPPEPKQKHTGFFVPLKYRGGLLNRIKRDISPFLDKNARIVGIPDRCDSRVFSRLKTVIEMKDKSNIIISLHCECKTKVIMRKTKYAERAEEIITSLNKQYKRKGKCTDNNHVFSELTHLQCANYTLMNKSFDMLAYANRDKLMYTQFNPPVFRLEKHLRVHNFIN